jgi:hypothetical protein
MALKRRMKMGSFQSMHWNCGYQSKDANAKCEPTHPNIALHDHALRKLALDQRETHL